MTQQRELLTKRQFDQLDIDNLLEAMEHEMGSVTGTIKCPSGEKCIRERFTGVLIHHRLLTSTMEGNQTNRTLISFQRRREKSSEQCHT
ncbi:hypothetical protein [Endozoicomonas sp. 2B-B]